LTKRATITDVASKAGVSIKTVSRVINREPNVRDSVRERVLAAADELGYAPSLSARALAGTRSYVLALMFDNPSLAYVAEIQLGALQRCRELGYHLIVDPIDSAALDRESLEAALAAARPDGIILTPPLCDNALALEAIEAAGLVHVRIAPSGDLARGPYVRTDDRAAAKEMTLKLIDMGHETVAFVRGHRAHGAAAARFDGYADALKARGLKLDKTLVAQGDFGFDSGAACGEALLKRPKPPTAIFAANDDMARGVLAAAERLGLAVPEDLSVAGFDDTPAARTVWPPLTTVRQPIRDLAAAAVEIAVALASQSGDVEPSRTLDTEIVMRASTAPRSSRG
jgi:LacI family transcriptional regulator